MRCLRCPTTELLELRGALLESICPSCQGRVFDASTSARLLEDHCGIERSLLGELCAHYRGRTPCPSCARAMSAVPVGTIVVDLCGSCGALFLDRGELRHLSRGAVDEIEVAPSPTTAPEGPPTPPVSTSAPSSSSSSSGAGGRPAGRDAAVFLREPLVGDDAVAVLLEVWRRAGFRTAVDARAMVGRAAGGVFADDCSVEEGERLVQALRDLGRVAAVVAGGAVHLPAAFRQKELGVSATAITVTDGLGRPRDVPVDDVRVLAAGNARVVVTEAAASASAPGGLMRKAAETMAPRAIRRAVEHFEVKDRMPSTTMAERQQLFLDVVVGDERFRLDDAGFVARADGPRSLRELAARLVEVAPAAALRQRGVAALIRGEPPPTFRTPRELDREVTWALWRRGVG